MRISDWSSDVCSSDLGHLALDAGVARPAQPLLVEPPGPRQIAHAESHQAKPLFHCLLLSRIGAAKLARTPGDMLLSFAASQTRHAFLLCRARPPRPAPGTLHHSKDI